MYASRLWGSVIVTTIESSSLAFVGTSHVIEIKYKFQLIIGALDQMVVRQGLVPLRE
jgi:hypothetical protein